jgi:hypothetical protein
MAKLEEKITPSDLLTAIRGGRLKDELIKEFRSSDEELAMMLLPLYRSGELKKDEFNKFFKGESLTEEVETPGPEKAEAPEKEQEVDHDAPTEFLGAFSRVFSRKPNAEKAPEAPPEEPETHEQRQEAPTRPVFEAMKEAEEEEPPVEPAEEADMDLDLKDTAEVEAESEEEPEVEPELEPDFGQLEDEEDMESSSADSAPIAVVEAVSDEPPAAEPTDESGTLRALEDIRSRLDSIESRLAKLESTS